MIERTSIIITLTITINNITTITVTITITIVLCNISFIFQDLKKYYKDINFIKPNIYSFINCSIKQTDIL